MTSLKNKLCIDFASNPAWGALFTTSKTGDKVTMKVTFSIDEVDASKLVASLDEVKIPELDTRAATPPPGEDGDEGSGPPAEPPDTSVDPKAPVFIAMGRSKSKEY